MYSKNAVEDKIVGLYQTGDIEKAINHTKLIGYSKPILVDMKMQFEWLDAETLCKLCDLTVGEIYNKSIPWLFFIHDSAFKVMPLAPLVHSISYADLANNGLTGNIKIPSMDNNSTAFFVKNSKSRHINVHGSHFQVTLLHTEHGTHSSEQHELYSYIMSNRIASYIDSIDEYQNFEYNLMEEYGCDRRYDFVWCDGENDALYFELEPHEMMDWDFTMPLRAIRNYVASGNKMTWLPVLRFRGKN